MAQPKDYEEIMARETRRFKLDTTVSIAHILTTVALLFKLFEWGGSVETRLSNADIEITNIKTERAEQAARISGAISEMKADMRNINDKLDRIIMLQRGEKQSR